MIEQKSPPFTFSQTAFAWIRDGVLINRMHINPVAFAFAYFFAANTDASCDELIALINFGFAKSGISCREKIQAFREDCDVKPAFADETLARAVCFYNDLGTKMASSCTYFPGFPNLLRQLMAGGGSNFITSAVEQEVLDAWLRTREGNQIASSMTEILGKRPDFEKGRDHFAYISARIDNSGRIIAIADAPAEIATAVELSSQFNILPIGFAFVVERAAVTNALKMAILLTKSHPVFASAVAAFEGLDDIAIASALTLPDEAGVIGALQAAGAAHVVSGAADKIVGNLSRLLLAEGAIADD
jgi:hypothetical protein